MKKKVSLISASNEIELVKKLNESKLDIFATQPIQKQDNSWVAFVYSEEKESKELEAEKPVVFDPNAPATSKQISFLKKLKIQIPNNLTKREASFLISKNKPQDY
jgi:hypothetical protein